MGWWSSNPRVSFFVSETWGWTPPPLEDSKTETESKLEGSAQPWGDRSPARSIVDGWVGWVTSHDRFTPKRFLRLGFGKSPALSGKSRERWNIIIWPDNINAMQFCFGGAENIGKTWNKKIHCVFVRGHSMGHIFGGDQTSSKCCW